MNLPLLSAFFLLAASSFAAANPTVTKAYSYTDRLNASLDDGCVSAMLEEITPAFEGLQQVTLNNTSIVRTQGGYLGIYPGAKFVSLYGDAEGSLTCIFALDGLNVNVTDVAVAFEGRGLGGFKNDLLAKTSDDPAENRVTMLSQSIPLD